MMGPMTRRQALLGAGGMGIGLLGGGGGLPWQAQEPPAKVPRIGYLSTELPNAMTGSYPSADGFREGLRDLGYVDGQNIVIEYRLTEGQTEQLGELAAELVRLPVDVLLT